MEIIIKSGLKGAKEATGLAVIIDVFRAFTTVAFILNNKAKMILPVGSLEDAFKLKKENPDYVLCGERHGAKPDGFDYGNSPTEIANKDFTNATIVFTTSSGTQGIVNAKNANEILAASFINANAVIKYLKQKNPLKVILVPMGSVTKGIKREEDEFCAQFIKDSLENKCPDFSEIENYLKKSERAGKFYDEKLTHFPKQDLDYCLGLNRFNFIIKVKKENNQFVMIKENI